MSVEPDVTIDENVKTGIQQWEALKFDRNSLARSVDMLKEQLAAFRAENDELKNTNVLLRQELEHYRKAAIEAKSHLNILRGHINGACQQMNGVPDPMYVQEQLSSRPPSEQTLQRLLSTGVQKELDK